MKSPYRYGLRRAALVIIALPSAIAGCTDEPPAIDAPLNVILVSIDTLRAEFEAPAAPFVVATIGFGGWEMGGLAKVVADAQLAVSGDAGNYARYVGNVKTVETRGFWRAAEASPRDQGFHYHQNAGVYMDVGTALGHGMLELLGKK